jgi:hypothetical protein
VGNKNGNYLRGAMARPSVGQPSGSGRWLSAATVGGGGRGRRRCGRHEASPVGGLIETTAMKIGLEFHIVGVGQRRRG